jgi:hypothetical protein
VDYLNEDKETLMKLERHAGVVVFSSGPLGTPSTIELKCTQKPSSMFLNTMPVNFKYDETRKMASITVEKNIAIDLKILTNM